VIYTHAAAALLALALGFAGGWQVQGWRWRAAEAGRLEQERESTRAQARAADAAAGGHEQDKAVDRARFQVIYRDVDHVVEKAVYRNVCIDDAGLRLLERAVAGAGVAASEPAAAVPAAGRPD
jgi:hypothetical protein